MHKTAVLIVEDQTYMRRALRDYLHAAYPDATLLEAEDGGCALALCREHGPQLALVDVGLPDCNGIDLTAQIKCLLPATHVIIVSAHSGSAYTERAQAAGAFAYVVKDNVHRELLPHVQSVFSAAATNSAPLDQG